MLHPGDDRQYEQGQHPFHSICEYPPQRLFENLLPICFTPFLPGEQRDITLVEKILFLELLFYHIPSLLVRLATSYPQPNQDGLHVKQGLDDDLCGFHRGSLVSHSCLFFGHRSSTNHFHSNHDEFARSSSYKDSIIRWRYWPHLLRHRRKWLVHRPTHSPKPQSLFLRQNGQTWKNAKGRRNSET